MLLQQRSHGGQVYEWGGIMGVLEQPCEVAFIFHVFKYVAERD